MSPHFLIAAPVVVIHAMTIGLGPGRRAALRPVPGNTAGIVPHVVAAALGRAA